MSVDIQPNLVDYPQTRRNFSWSEVRSELGAAINIAELIERHLEGACAEKTALRWLSKGGAVEEYSYRQLVQQCNRFANVLATLGLQPGQRVFSLAGRIPSLYFAVLGTLKSRAVFCPLFSAFGPEPIVQRLERGNAQVLLTTTKLYRKKVAPLRQRLPELRFILLCDGEQDLADDVLALGPLMHKASDSYDAGTTDPEDMALLHFTSGTTGMPKGAVHVHQAALTHYVTGKYVLDLHPDDVFWCTADPGWVTGTSYGILAPFLHGLTNVVDEAEFDASRWYQILQDHRVNVWYTAPTAIRRLMRLDLQPRQQYDLSRLRHIHSVGEPLNPEAINWSSKALGLPIHDNWWQSETGGIMIANYPGTPIKPGSMGRPLPGIQAGIVRRTDDGSAKELVDANAEGELALKRGWPSMFRGYLHEEERYQKCFCGDWYMTGDLARKDEDGYYWFVGRADDIIKTSGHMVGPFEVESALIEHPKVAEAAVIGKPEPLIGQLVKAFVALNPGVEQSPELARELTGFARKKLGPAVAPKEIEFRDSLPKTRSGKIMRRLLKARELGLPEGDTSTLEADS